MTIYDAYAQAIDEEDDPAERELFSTDSQLKTLVIEEILESMKEIRNNKSPNRTAVELVKPLFNCVAFWFIIGIRVGKILQAAELQETK